MRIQEYTTAAGGLSVSRQAVLEDLSRYGGTVVGKGKGAFTGGTEIKPGTSIDVISQKTGNRVISTPVSKYSDLYNYEYNSYTNPGPLDNLRGRPSINFYGGHYNVEVLDSPKILYRAGDSSNPLGQWFTENPPMSEAEVRINTAVKPIWTDRFGNYTGSSPINTVYEIKLPEGTKFTEGQ